MTGAKENFTKMIELHGSTKGLAEYLAGSTYRDGVVLRESIMNRINNDGPYRLTVQQITESSYQSGFKFYRYSNLLIDYLITNQDWTVRSLMECMYKRY